MMYKRLLLEKIERALKDTPVVYVAGPRQAGKSTLVKTLSPGSERPYFSMDDVTHRSNAEADPTGYIASLPHKCAIDEIQRTPSLMLPIKLSVDNDRAAGRFLLTGSANILALPQISDSLAGRMEIYNLYPLAYQEKTTQRNDWISHIFKKPLTEIFTHPSPHTKNDNPIEDFIHSGGFPEAQEKHKNNRHTTWFQSYLQTLIERDIRDILHVEETSRIRTILSFLAARSGTLLNTSDISRLSGVPNSTTTLYLAVLETLFLTSKIPAWFINRGKQLTKKPKIFFNDTGFLCHLLALQSREDMLESKDWGRILETFIYGELVKQISFQERLLNIYHYRSVGGLEVDFLIENGPNQIFGIEVKSSKSLGPGDFKGLKSLKEDYPDLFKGGIVLYRGDTLTHLGDNRAAVPLHMVL